MRGHRRPARTAQRVLGVGAKAGPGLGSPRVGPAALSHVGGAEVSGRAGGRGEGAEVALLRRVVGTGPAGGQVHITLSAAGTPWSWGKGPRCSRRPGCGTDPRCPGGRRAATSADSGAPVPRPARLGLRGRAFPSAWKSPEVSSPLVSESVLRRGPVGGRRHLSRLPARACIVSFSSGHSQRK